MYKLQDDSFCQEKKKEESLQLQRLCLDDTL